MRAWGTGIKDNDTSSDIYDDFFDFYNEGQKPADISKKLIANNQELIRERFDSNNFWLTLALAQWETKSLDSEIFQRVKIIVESGQDIQVWKELDADDDTLKKRQRDLEKFLLKISVEKVKPKGKERSKRPVFLKGDCLVFKLDNGNYGGAIVLAADTKYGYNLVVTTRLNQPNIPTAKDFENSVLLYIKDSDLKDEPQTTWYIRNHFKTEGSHHFEIATTIKIDREYNPNDKLPFKVSYSGMWQLIVEKANKQFAYELTNKKPSRKLTIKELIKNKSFWKFW